MDTAVAFLIFNRPTLTRRVFERIRDARPPVLLIVADGPRRGYPADSEKCRLAREVVDTGVDWPCRVLKNYSATNLGCGRRISSGLDWVFSEVEEAIILEDDCLPDLGFFRFCEELLFKYRDDSRIALISGDNFFPGGYRGTESYCFTQYAHVWGWATWRRFWQGYDFDLKLWPSNERRIFESIYSTDRSRSFMSGIFQKILSKELDTWDYQVTFACWHSGASCIIPRVNLVENLGFTRDATHTSGSARDLPAGNGISFPLKHPSEIQRNEENDAFVTRQQYSKPRLAQRVWAALAKRLAPHTGELG